MRRGAWVAMQETNTYTLRLQVYINWIFFLYLFVFIFCFDIIAMNIEHILLYIARDEVENL